MEKQSSRMSFIKNVAADSPIPSPDPAMFSSVPLSSSSNHNINQINNTIKYNNVENNVNGKNSDEEKIVSDKNSTENKNESDTNKKNNSDYIFGNKENDNSIYDSLIRKDSGGNIDIRAKFTFRDKIKKNNDQLSEYDGKDHDGFVDSTSEKDDAENFSLNSREQTIKKRKKQQNENENENIVENDKKGECSYYKNRYKKNTSKKRLNSYRCLVEARKSQRKKDIILLMIMITIIMNLYLLLERIGIKKIYFLFYFDYYSAVFFKIISSILLILYCFFCLRKCECVIKNSKDISSNSESDNRINNNVFRNGNSDNNKNENVSKGSNTVIFSFFNSLFKYEHNINNNNCRSNKNNCGNQDNNDNNNSDNNKSKQVLVKAICSSIESTLSNCTDSLFRFYNSTINEYDREHDNNNCANKSNKRNNDVYDQFNEILDNKKEVNNSESKNNETKTNGIRKNISNQNNEFYPQICDLFKVSEFEFVNLSEEDNNDHENNNNRSENDNNGIDMNGNKNNNNNNKCGIDRHHKNLCNSNDDQSVCYYDTTNDCMILADYDFVKKNINIFIDKNEERKILKSEYYRNKYIFILIRGFCYYLLSILFEELLYLYPFFNFNMNIIIFNINKYRPAIFGLSPHKQRQREGFHQYPDYDENEENYFFFFFFRVILLILSHLFKCKSVCCFFHAVTCVFQKDLSCPSSDQLKSYENYNSTKENTCEHKIKCSNKNSNYVYYLFSKLIIFMGINEYIDTDNICSSVMETKKRIDENYNEYIANNNSKKIDNSNNRDRNRNRNRNDYDTDNKNAYDEYESNFVKNYIEYVKNLENSEDVKSGDNEWKYEQIISILQRIKNNDDNYLNDMNVHKQENTKDYNNNQYMYEMSLSSADTAISIVSEYVYDNKKNSSTTNNSDDIKRKKKISENDTTTNNSNKGKSNSNRSSFSNVFFLVSLYLLRKVKAIIKSNKNIFVKINKFLNSVVIKIKYFYYVYYCYYYYKYAYIHMNRHLYRNYNNYVYRTYEKYIHKYVYFVQVNLLKKSKIKSKLSNINSTEIIIFSFQVFVSLIFFSIIFNSNELSIIRPPPKKLLSFSYPSLSSSLSLEAPSLSLSTSVFPFSSSVAPLIFSSLSLSSTPSASSSYSSFLTSISNYLTSLMPSVSLSSTPSSSPSLKSPFYKLSSFTNRSSPSSTPLSAPFTSLSSLLSFSSLLPSSSTQSTPFFPLMSYLSSFFSYISLPSWIYEYSSSASLSLLFLTLFSPFLTFSSHLSSLLSRYFPFVLIPSSTSNTSIRLSSPLLTLLSQPSVLLPSVLLLTISLLKKSALLLRTSASSFISSLSLHSLQKSISSLSSSVSLASLLSSSIISLSLSILLSSFTPFSVFFSMIIKMCSPFVLLFSSIFSYFLSLLLYLLLSVNYKLFNYLLFSLLLYVKIITFIICLLLITSIKKLLKNIIKHHNLIENKKRNSCDNSPKHNCENNNNNNNNNDNNICDENTGKINKNICENNHNTIYDNRNIKMKYNNNSKSINSFIRLESKYIFLFSLILLLLGIFFNSLTLLCPQNICRINRNDKLSNIYNNNHNKNGNNYFFDIKNNNYHNTYFYEDDVNDNIHASTYSTHTGNSRKINSNENTFFDFNKKIDDNPYYDYNSKQMKSYPRKKDDNNKNNNKANASFHTEENIFFSFFEKKNKEDDNALNILFTNMDKYKKYFKYYYIDNIFDENDKNNDINFFSSFVTKFKKWIRTLNSGNRLFYVYNINKNDDKNYDVGTGNNNRKNHDSNNSHNDNIYSYNYNNYMELVRNGMNKNDHKDNDTKKNVKRNHPAKKCINCVFNSEDNNRKSLFDYLPLYTIEYLEKKRNNNKYLKYNYNHDDRNDELFYEKRDLASNNDRNDSKLSFFFKMMNVNNHKSKYLSKIDINDITIEKMNAKNFLYYSESDQDNDMIKDFIIPDDNSEMKSNEYNDTNKNDLGERSQSLFNIFEHFFRKTYDKQNTPLRRIIEEIKRNINRFYIARNNIESRLKDSFIYKSLNMVFKNMFYLFYYEMYINIFYNKIFKTIYNDIYINIMYNRIYIHFLYNTLYVNIFHNYIYVHAYNTLFIWLYKYIYTGILYNYICIQIHNYIYVNVINNVFRSILFENLFYFFYNYIYLNTYIFFHNNIDMYLCSKLYYLYISVLHAFIYVLHTINKYVHMEKLFIVFEYIFTNLGVYSLALSASWFTIKNIYTSVLINMRYRPNE